MVPGESVPELDGYCVWLLADVLYAPILLLQYAVHSTTLSHVVCSTKAWLITLPVNTTDLVYDPTT
eukprot:3940528-Rhodomonas_salina.4